MAVRLEDVERVVELLAFVTEQTTSPYDGWLYVSLLDIDGIVSVACDDGEAKDSQDELGGQVEERHGLVFRLLRFRCLGHGCRDWLQARLVGGVVGRCHGVGGRCRGDEKTGKSVEVRECQKPAVRPAVHVQVLFFTCLSHPQDRVEITHVRDDAGQQQHASDLHRDR